jgi:hypothetical protein
MASPSGHQYCKPDSGLYIASSMSLAFCPKDLAFVAQNNMLLTFRGILDYRFSADPPSALPESTLPECVARQKYMVSLLWQPRSNARDREASERTKKEVEGAVRGAAATACINDTPLTHHCHAPASDCCTLAEESAYPGPPPFL